MAFGGHGFQGQTDQERRHPPSNEVVNSNGLGPFQPTLPESMHRLRLGGGGGEHIGLDGEKHAARLEGRHHSLDRLLWRLNVMEHGPGCHQVVSVLFDSVFENIELPDFEIWYNKAGDVARVNVTGNDMTARRHPARQPLRS